MSLRLGDEGFTEAFVRDGREALDALRADVDALEGARAGVPSLDARVFFGAFRAFPAFGSRFLVGAAAVRADGRCDEGHCADAPRAPPLDVAAPRVKWERVTASLERSPGICRIGRGVGHALQLTLAHGAGHAGAASRTASACRRSVTASWFVRRCGWMQDSARVTAPAQRDRPGDPQCPSESALPRRAIARIQAAHYLRAPPRPTPAGPAAVRVRRTVGARTRGYPRHTSHPREGRLEIPREHDEGWEARTTMRPQPPLGGAGGMRTPLRSENVPDRAARRADECALPAAHGALWVGGRRIGRMPALFCDGRRTDAQTSGPRGALIVPTSKSGRAHDRFGAVVLVLFVARPPRRPTNRHQLRTASERAIGNVGPGRAKGLLDSGGGAYGLAGTSDVARRLWAEMRGE